MIIAFLSAWAGDNEPLQLPCTCIMPIDVNESLGAQKLLDHMLHLENNKDKGMPLFFFFELGKESISGLNTPSLSRWSQLRRNNFPRVVWLPLFQGELFMRKGWSGFRDCFRLPRSLLLRDVIRKC